MDIGEPEINGILLIDKEKGWTSHDVVAKVRKLLGIKKVGHTGTLDPAATGLLILCLGKATKIARFIEEDKGYIAEIRLGVSTDTLDSEGKVVRVQKLNGITADKIANTCEKFVGTLLQTPPVFSAVKVRGKRSYELARHGEHVGLEPRKIRIYNIRVIEYTEPFLKIEVLCSKGTYIRSLARDIGESLGCGAHISELRRTRIGHFKVEDALSIQGVEEAVKESRISDYVVDISDALRGYPVLKLESRIDVGRFCNGASVRVDVSVPSRGVVRVMDSGGNLIGVGRVTPEGELRALRVICG